MLCTSTTDMQQSIFFRNVSNPSLNARVGQMANLSSFFFKLLVFSLKVI